MDRREDERESQAGNGPALPFPCPEGRRPGAGSTPPPRAYLAGAMRIAAFLSCFLVGGGILGGEGGQKQVKPEGTAESAMDESVDRAVLRGLNYVASRQGRTGMWEESEYALAVSAMAGLSLMGYGHPVQGRFGPHITAYTRFLLSQISREGFISKAGEERRAFGHAFSVLFLTQIYGMLSREDNLRVKEAVLKSTAFIEAAQDEKGCWYQDYDPGGHDDLVTISQIHALRAANATGFRVDHKRIDAAVRFIETCNFLDQSLGMRASYIATLLVAGKYSHPRLPEALAVITRDLTDPRNSANYRLEDLNFPIFTHMYASQVMYFTGGNAWDTYYRRFKEYALRTQVPYGKETAYWPGFRNVHAFSPGAVYSTANISLILQMPKDYIPFYESVKSDIKAR